MNERLESMRCDCCGKILPVLFMLDADIWKMISPTGTRDGMLCAYCIIDRLRALGFNVFFLSSKILKDMKINESDNRSNKNDNDKTDR